MLLEFLPHAALSSKYPVKIEYKFNFLHYLGVN